MFSKQMAMIVGIIMLIIISVMMLSISSHRPYQANGPGRFAIALVAPFQKVISHSSRFFREIWGHYFFLVSVAEENERLREMAQQTLALQHQNEELVQANERLAKMLTLKRKLERPAVAAQVVGKDPSPWFQTVLVDKGRQDGVDIGHPVLNPAGVVGLVVEAGGRSSKVMLITDPNSAVDAVLQKSRARAIIKGGTSGYCVLQYVLRKNTVEIGDSVISSGMDGVFPKGLPIGQVLEIDNKESGIFQEVSVMPFVDFERLEEVLIIPPTDLPTLK